MNTGGEAAEQIVRMSLEGFEVAAKITGAGAKNIAILLYSILKEEKKTKGKARLTSMLRSGKELKVFTVKSGDLKKFTFMCFSFHMQYRQHGHPSIRPHRFYVRRRQRKRPAEALPR